MADNYKIALEKANYRYKASIDALQEIRLILGYMTAFHIKTMTGTSFTLGEPVIDSTVPVLYPTSAPGIPNTAEAVVIIKNKLDKLRKVFYPIFKKELKPLSPSDIAKFKCFSAADLFKSTELVSALNKCYSAMAATAKTLNNARSQANAAASNTPNKQMTSAALSSSVPAVDRLFDKQTSDVTISEEYKEKAAKNLEEQTKLLNEAVSEKEEFPGTILTQQSIGAIQLSIFGLTPRIPNSVSDTVTDFNIWLLSKQYPKGMRYCNARRTQNTNNIVQSTNLRREQALSESGIQATQLSSLGSSSSTVQTGAELTSSPAYNAVINRIKESLDDLRRMMAGTSLSQEKVQSLTSRLITLDLNMRNSDDLQAQKDYMTLINGLGQEIDALKASYGPGYKAQQEALANSISLSRAATQSRSPAIRTGNSTPYFGGENEAKVQTSRRQLENILSAPNIGKSRTPESEYTKERIIRESAQAKRDSEAAVSFGRSAEEELLKKEAELKSSAGRSS